MKLAQPAGVVVGIALMVAPAVAGYAGTAGGDLHRVVGPLAVSVAVIACWDATRAVRWANVLLAAILVFSPVAVDYATDALVVSLVAGVVLAAVTPFGGTPSHRFAGGWRAVFGHGGRGREALAGGKA